MAAQRMTQTQLVRSLAEHCEVPNKTARSFVVLLLIRVIRVNLRLNCLFCFYGLAGAADGLAIVVTRFFHSAGVVDLSCGNSAAAITSFRTLVITTNSSAPLGFAASSSLANCTSRHSGVAGSPVDSRDMASRPAAAIAERLFAKGLASCRAGDRSIIGPRARLAVCQSTNVRSRSAR